MKKYSIRGSTVLVTGAGGFIGSHLVNSLLSLGAERVFAVDSLVYGTTRNLDLKNKKLTFVKFDLGRDPIKNLEKYLRKSDFVFHLAAQKHNQSSKEPDAVYTTNIKGTADLFETAGKAGVKKIIFSSSLYAYGRMKPPAMEETDIPSPHTIYGISKLAGEHFLAYFGKLYNFDHVSLRFFFVYGPKQYPGLGYKSVIVKNFERLLEGQAPIINGDGSQSLDYIYVDDIVDAVTKVTESNVSGEVFNVGSGQSTKIKDLTKIMISVSDHKKISPTRAPADWTAGTARFSNTQKMKRVLKWQPRISLHEGLARTFEWLKSQKI